MWRKKMWIIHFHIALGKPCSSVPITLAGTFRTQERLAGTFSEGRLVWDVSFLCVYLGKGDMFKFCSAHHPVTDVYDTRSEYAAMVCVSRPLWNYSHNMKKPNWHSLPGMLEHGFTSSRSFPWCIGSGFCTCYLWLASVLVVFPTLSKVDARVRSGRGVTFILSDCFTRGWRKEPRSCERWGAQRLVVSVNKSKKTSVYSARARSATKSNIWLNSLPQYESRVLQKNLCEAA
jgi:hypothetical protein